MEIPEWRHVIPEIKKKKKVVEWIKEVMELGIHIRG